MACWANHSARPEGAVVPERAQQHQRAHAEREVASPSPGIPLALGEELQRSRADLYLGASRDEPVAAAVDRRLEDLEPTRRDAIGVRVEARQELGAEPSRQLPSPSGVGEQWYRQQAGVAVQVAARLELGMQQRDAGSRVCLDLEPTSLLDLEPRLHATEPVACGARHLPLAVTAIAAPGALAAARGAALGASLSHHPAPAPAGSTAELARTSAASTGDLLVAPAARAHGEHPGLAGEARGIDRPRVDQARIGTRADLGRAAPPGRAGPQSHVPGVDEVGGPPVLLSLLPDLGDGGSEGRWQDPHGGPCTTGGMPQGRV